MNFSREGRTAPGAFHFLRRRSDLLELLEHGLLISGAMPTRVSLTDTSTDPSLALPRPRSARRDGVCIDHRRRAVGA
jgi:hypothetical protein